jgi:hypothetical protein
VGVDDFAADRTEEYARQARRMQTAMRLAIVPLVAVLAAILFLGRGDDAVGKPVTTKLGVTTQGRQFKLGLDSKGHPSAFATQLVALCPNGNMIGMPWDPAAVDGVRFARDGDRLHVQETGDGWKLSLDGTAAEGGSMRGSLSLVVHIAPKSKPAYDCTSPHVRFSAGA